jgi:hypothetical protein
VSFFSVSDSLGLAVDVGLLSLPARLIWPGPVVCRAVPRVSTVIGGESEGRGVSLILADAPEGWLVVPSPDGAGLNGDGRGVVAIAVPDGFGVMPTTGLGGFDVIGVGCASDGGVPVAFVGRITRNVSGGLFVLRAVVVGEGVAVSLATVVDSFFGSGELDDNLPFSTNHPPSPTNTMATMIAIFVSRRMLIPSASGGWGGNVHVPDDDHPSRVRHAIIICGDSGYAARSNPKCFSRRSIYRKTVSGQGKSR